MGKIRKNKIIEDRIIFEAVFENCMDAILLTSPDGNIYLANQAACSMFQMTEEEICDLGRKGLVDTDSPHLTKMLEEREQTGRTSGELIMRKKDGTKFPVEISTSVFTDNTGQLKTSMVIRDITERKQAEERLRASEAQLRAIHESLTEGIVYLDTNGTVVSINSAVSKVLGRSLQDLTDPELDPRWRIVRSDGSLLPVEEQPAILALRTGESVRDVEMGVPLPDGTIKWILVNAELVRDSLRTTLGVVVSFRDITRRKQAKEKIRYQANLLAQVNDAVIASDENFILSYWNKCAEKMYGWKAEDVIGKKSTSVLDPLFESTTHEQAVQQLLNSGETRTTGTHLRKDGTRVAFEAHTIALYDDLNKISGFVSINRDITERKQAEERLRYQSVLLANVNDAIVASDAQYRLTAWNAAAESLYGWKAEEVLGRFGLDITRTEWPEVEAEEMRRSIAETGSWRGEAIQVRKDGTRVPVEISSMVLHDENGLITGYVSVNRDITERKHAEEEVRRLNERITLATRSAKIGIWDWDINTNELIWDDKMYEIYGREKDTFKGAYETWLHSLHPDDKKRSHLESEKARSSEKEYDTEFRIIHPDGNVRYIKAYGDVFRDLNGNAVRMLGVNFDITEQKKVEIFLRESEESLKQTSQELRGLSRHLDELIEKERSEIARDLHDDLGQKLTAVNLYISWIKSRVGVQSGSISDKIDSIKNLLNDTVKSMHEISYRLRPSILEDLGLQSAVELQLADFSKSTGIGYSVSFIPEKLVVDYGISLMLFRIIQESLTNVARHSNATKVTVDVSFDEADLKLIIRDNGIGLEKDYQRKLKSFGILGMRERALAYGGEFQIEGIKDNGTMVTVKIPLVN
jgi:PAS domain S-box-containing protein